MEERIAIIGAMDEEIEELSESLTLKKRVSTPFPDLPIFTGSLGGKEVVLGRCGIGKVNAALATQYIIDRFHPPLVINSGIAGGVSSKVRIGDIVLGARSMQHDFDVREFGHPRGTIPRLSSSIFQGDPSLLEAATVAARQTLDPDKVHRGLIISGDQFICSPQQKKDILDFFPEAMCVEMEGAAIAHVATANQVPHLILRAISDLADSTAPDDFKRFVAKIVPVLDLVIQRLLASLAN